MRQLDCAPDGCEGHEAGQGCGAHHKGKMARVASRHEHGRQRLQRASGPVAPRAADAVGIGQY